MLFYSFTFSNNTEELLKFFILFILLSSINLFAQNSLKIKVFDEHSEEVLPGVNIVVLNTGIGASTNDQGIAELSGIPDGAQSIKISYIGFKEEIIDLVFPLTGEPLLEIELEGEAEELEELIVTSTRSSRLIDDEPTRVEILAGEEVDEKLTMDPSGLSMLLNESTGIQVQQTSASSVNTTFRIQGLDGRYTQLLRDGLPLYSGYAGSLSINQIPPIDLQQIEIIKGSSSTLYGGGAIAGLINLISKTPGVKRDLSFLVNGTSALGLDLSGYYSENIDKSGISLFVSKNNQRAYDNNDDSFTDLPETDRISISPNYYYHFDENNTIQIGGSFLTETRLGGYIPTIDDNADSAFTEENKSNRYSSLVKFDSRLTENSTLSFKGTAGYFKRNITVPDYFFKGTQFSAFSELAYAVKENASEWIFGINFLYDDFSDLNEDEYNTSFSLPTFGGFLQNTLNISEDIIFEGGFRADFNKDYGWSALPRVSLLVKWTDEFTLRAGGGMGYKLPTMFTEDAEEIFYRNILPLANGELETERSWGTNLDMNYKIILSDEIALALNNLFFYTNIDKPLVLVPEQELFSFQNFAGNYDTKGMETNIRISYDHYKLFLSYTFTAARSHQGDSVIQNFPLTPKNKAGMVLIYEEHGSLRIGLEAYYTGKQKLISGGTTEDFWITGLMAEKVFGNISLFINFENFLDTKQSNYGPMYTGSIYNPEFAEIYAPTDGRIINGGVKVRL